MTDRPLRLHARETSPGQFEVLLDGEPIGEDIYRHETPGQLPVYEVFGRAGWFYRIHEALDALEQELDS